VCSTAAFKSEKILHLQLNIIFHTKYLLTALSSVFQTYSDVLINKNKFLPYNVRNASQNNSFIIVMALTIGLIQYQLRNSDQQQFHQYLQPIIKGIKKLL